MVGRTPHVIDTIFSDLLADLPSSPHGLPAKMSAAHHAVCCLTFFFPFSHLVLQAWRRAVYHSLGLAPYDEEALVRLGLLFITADLVVRRIAVDGPARAASIASAFVQEFPHITSAIPTRRLTALLAVDSLPLPSDSYVRAVWVHQVALDAGEAEEPPVPPEVREPASKDAIEDAHAVTSLPVPEPDQSLREIATLSRRIPPPPAILPPSPARGAAVVGVKRPFDNVVADSTPPCSAEGLAQSVTAAESSTAALVAAYATLRAAEGEYFSFAEKELPTPLPARHAAQLRKLLVKVIKSTEEVEAKGAVCRAALGRCQSALPRALGPAASEVDAR